MSKLRITRKNTTNSTFDELSRDLHPNSPKLFQNNEKPLASQTKFQETIATMKTILQQQQESHTPLLEKKTKKSQSKKGYFSSRIPTTMTEQTRQLQYIQSIEDENEQLTHQLEDLRKEFDRYKEVSELRHETFIRREKRAEEKESLLRDKLRQATELHHESYGDAQDSMQRLHGLKSQVHDEIERIRQVQEKQLNQRKDEHKAELDDTIRKFSKAMEAQREQQCKEEQSWMEKSASMKRQLQEAINQAIMLDEMNQKLQKKNLDLKIKYKAQSGDRGMVTKSMAVLRRENAKLKERIQQLTQDLDYQRTIAEQLDAELHKEKEKALQGPSGNIVVDAQLLQDKTDKYEETILRQKKLLEQERNRLKQLRKQHIQVLSERSELEIFLRQCIDDVKVSVEQRDQTVVFGEKERDQVVERLLSKEKVRSMLYEQIFPNRMEPQVTAD